MKEFVIWGARGSQELLEARFCNGFVKEVVIWGARDRQRLLEARFCNKFVKDWSSSQPEVTRGS